MSPATFGRRPSVVALGGGHGLSVTLQAMRRVTDRITAVVTVADDGGSSGRLREQFDMLPPGDLRMALAALCGDHEEGRVWADVLQSRFGGEGPLAGHAIGNLLIAGVWQRLGDAVQGLDMVARLLEVQGRVLPMSNVPLEIQADVLGLTPLCPDEVTVVRGQASVAKSAGEVQSIRLIPENPPACPDALDAIIAADHVLLGPGSWFTSVIPHLLVPEILDALVTTRASRTLVLNLAPADETEGYSSARHLEILAEHAPRLSFDHIVADPTFIGDDAHVADFARSLGAELIIESVRLSVGSPRHDANRLASVFADILGR